MRLLLLTHRLPYAPNRGDRIRSYHLLRLLSTHHEVHVVSLVHDEEEASHAREMSGLAARVSIAPVSRAGTLARAPFALLGSTPLTHVLLDSSQMRPILEESIATFRPELTIAYCSGMARFALESPLERLPFIFDMVDVDSQKWAVLATSTRGPKGWVYKREAYYLARFEGGAAERAAFTTVVNAREQESLVVVAPKGRARVVPNGIDLASFRPTGPPSADARVVFTGVFNYQPNEEGALWMAEHVWPLVRASRPDARLVLVGASPTPAIRRLPTRDSSIEVTGTVPEVRPYLWNAAVAAVPLAAARGLQNKVLEALAAGLPAVVTPVVREGLPSQVAPGCTVASEPGTFADAVLDLLSKTPDERRALAARADLSSLDWSGQLNPFLEMIEQAAG
jgi:sugar transferase (PEP-CTERM/EpsH1 system associated)